MMAHRHTSQSGYTLFVGMILLTVLTTIGVSAMRDTLLEERMSFNFQDKHTAFQAAESALVYVERITVRGQSIDDLESEGGFVAKASIASVPNWETNTSSIPLIQAVDEGSNGVRCNAVAPGWIDTGLNEEYINSMPDPVRFRQEIGGIHPLNRTGSPEEVAELICWLASDAASFVTGQVWTIDGGRMAKLSLP